MPNCSVFVCKKRSESSSVQKDNVTFHLFPKDPVIRDFWMKACGNHPSWVPTRTSTICSQHFEMSCYMRLANKTRRLKHCSVPTLNLSQARPTEATMDDMLAVDPKLFITCRLCLDDMGKFQILPIVQEQIKFCYDIDVKPFDGLPQLICAKCRDILKEYHATKKLYVEKQNTLRQNLKNNVPIITPLQQQQDTVSSTQPQHDQTTNEKSNDAQYEVPIKVEFNKKSRATRERARICSDSDSETTFRGALSDNKTSKSQWEKKYKKYFMCTICNSPWSEIKYFNTHILGHSALRMKHAAVLSKYCTVRLNKIDDKPNITGYKNVVVHDKDKMIGCGNPFYYVLFSNKTNKKEHQKRNSSRSFGAVVDSSDDESLISKARRSKRMRIDSRSSLDTVVLDDKNNKHASDDDELKKKDQCINIDDSSEAEFAEGKTTPELSKRPLEATLSDFKTIHDIISTCTTNYNKKKEDDESLQQDIDEVTDQQLKHIILSLGRKVLNTDFNCAGLLKYLKYKNLEINWIPNQATGKEANYIRILAKEQRPPNTSNTVDWVPVDDNESNDKAPQANDAPLQNVADVSEGESVSNLHKEQNEPTTTNTATTSTVPDLTPISRPNDDIELFTDFQDAFAKYGASELRNKLLNANPVANPKQLPKKLLNEMNLKPVVPPAPTDNPIPYGMPLLDVEPIPNVIGSTTTFDESGFNNGPPAGLPIITSATSLAEPSAADTSKHSDATGAPGPRIKVKPVTELMSERSLGMLRKGQELPEGPATLIKHGDAFMAAAPVPSVRTYPMRLTLSPGGSLLQVINPNEVQPVRPSLTVSSKPGPSDGITVTLHTVELPNTKTKSPFQYFKNLLQVHNIVLKNSNESLPPEFLMLVKFKVVFRQDCQDQPVVLCLSLLGVDNMFCIKVKDGKQEDIDVYKFSANWQWEILQVFTGNVIFKVLQTASKLGPDIYDRTQQFFCLLKSIQMIK